MVKVCGREDKRETDFVCYGMVDHVLTTQRITHIKHVMTEKAMAPHSSSLAWKTHGWRSMVGYSPWGCLESDTHKESDTTERLNCLGGGGIFIHIRVCQRGERACKSKPQRYRISKQCWNGEKCIREARPPCFIHSDHCKSVC